MSQSTVEERLTALEQTVAQIVATSGISAPGKDWRSTVGMFANNEVMKQIDEEGRRIREADRQKANS